jgi:hypothetical protein
MAQRGYRTIKLPRKSGEVVPVYASPRVADAMQQMVKKASVYEGVKLLQVLEAAYDQGKKDGARETYEAMNKRIAEVGKEIPARPGRPRLKRGR